MKASDSAMLLWDNGKSANPVSQYSIVAKSKNGKMTFKNRNLWQKFEDFGDLDVPEHDEEKKCDEPEPAKKQNETWLSRLTHNDFKSNHKSRSTGI